MAAAAILDLKTVSIFFLIDQSSIIFGENVMTSINLCVANSILQSCVVDAGGVK